jgi:hypothetical protein
MLWVAFKFPCPTTFPGSAHNRLLLYHPLDKSPRSLCWPAPGAFYVGDSGCHTVHLWADLSRKFCVWAEAYYQQKKTEGRNHAAALPCLGQRWLKILWKMWQTGKPYDEALHTTNQVRPVTPFPCPRFKEARPARTGNA